MRKSGIVLVILFVISVVFAAQTIAQDTSLSGTLRVGTWDTGAGLTVWDTVLGHFKEAYPNVTVSFEPVPQDYGTKLLAQFASNSAPDVFQVGDGDAAKYQALGVVENLDPYISGPNGFDPSIMYPGVFAFGQMGGGTYYLTKDYSPLILHYNKDLFDAAGVAYPSEDWTWDDFLTMAQMLTVDGNGNNATSADFDPSNIQRWGVTLPDAWGDLLWTRGILPIIYQNGGSLISEDGTTTTGYMNSQATVDAVQWYVDLFDTHHVAPNKTDLAAFAGVDLFATQQAAMLWNGVWNINGYAEGDNALTFNWGTSILPAGSAGNANALCWAGFAVYSGSENKDLAWEFIKYIAAGDGAKDFAEYALTTVQSIAEGQGLVDDPYKGQVMADLANVQPIPDFTTQYWADCGDKFFKQELETVMTGGVAVQEAMDKAAAEAAACLAEKAAGS
ncbi:MAG: sugar ABC transporter substrate-binding protein [Anaerolineae bacterium]|nr:sugar ABC transporter substrate-binding protein [Anaerolineae bacterium]